MIVSNVVVSFISAAHNSFPVVIFPPGPVFNRGEFLRLLRLSNSYDVIRVPDFEQPDHLTEDQYVKERLEHLNNCVLEYVELCRRHVSEKLGQLSDGPVELLLPAPETSEGEPSPPDEDGALAILGENLERIARGETVPDGPFRTALEVLQSHPHYDVEGFQAALLRPETLPIARLYVQKYRAVRAEQYEKAAGLKARIDELESRSQA